MKKIHDYRIVLARDARALRTAIERRLEAGWVRQGLPFTFAKAKRRYFAQEMVKLVKAERRKTRVITVRELMGS